MKTKLPEGWKEVELGDENICEIAGEYGSGASAVEYRENKPRYLRITDINENGILKGEKVSPNLIEEKYFLEPGDLLFARSGATVGKTYLFNGKEGKCQYAGYLIRYRFKRKIVDPRYIYYCTRTPRYISWIQSRMKVVAQPNINSKQYSSIKIPLPPLPTQQKIVSILEKAETLKQKREEADKKTKEYLQSVFVQMFGDPYKNKEKFLVRKIKEVVKLLNGRAFKPSEWSNHGLRIIRIQNLNNPLAEFNHYSGKIEEKNIVNNGDLLLSWSGTPGTSFGVFIWSGEKSVLNQHIFNVKIKDESLNKVYFQYFMNGKLSELISKSHGGVGLQHITKAELDNVDLVLPPLPLQQKFAKIVEQVEILKEKQKQSKENIDNLFNSLLQKAFKGELVE